MPNTSKAIISVSSAKKRIIASVEDYDLEEIEIILDAKLLDDETRAINIESYNLLSGEDSDYIRLEDAEKDTGIKAEELKEQAEKGEIESIRINDTFYLLRSSVSEYMRKNTPPNPL